MAYDSKKVETAEALFAAAIDLMKQNYNKPANEIPTSMVIADLAAKAIKWDCIAAQDVVYDLLEQGAAKVQSLKVCSVRDSNPGHPKSKDSLCNSRIIFDCQL